MVCDCKISWLVQWMSKVYTIDITYHTYDIFSLIHFFNVQFLFFSRPLAPLSCRTTLSISIFESKKSAVLTQHFCRDRTAELGRADVIMIMSVLQRESLRYIRFLDYATNIFFCYFSNEN